MHYHETLIKSTEMCLDTNGLADDERYLGILPNSHIYGLFAQVLAPMLYGSQVGFIEALNAKGLTKAFQSFKPTVIPAVPKIYELLKAQILKKDKCRQQVQKIVQNCISCMSAPAKGIRNKRRKKGIRTDSRSFRRTDADTLLGRLSHV